MVKRVQNPAGKRQNNMSILYILIGIVIGILISILNVILFTSNRTVSVISKTKRLFNSKAKIINPKDILDEVQI